ncbi:hypothetical protein DFH11DRAFT_1561356, partial [Phellopilus nigrolimitatus]
MRRPNGYPKQRAAQLGGWTTAPLFTQVTPLLILSRFSRLFRSFFSLFFSLFSPQMQDFLPIPLLCFFLFFYSFQDACAVPVPRIAVVTAALAS